MGSLGSTLLSRLAKLEPNILCAAAGPLSSSRYRCFCLAASRALLYLSRHAKVPGYVAVDKPSFGREPGTISSTQSKSNSAALGSASCSSLVDVEGGFGYRGDQRDSVPPHRVPKTTHDPSGSRGSQTPLALPLKQWVAPLPACPCRRLGLSWLRRHPEWSPPLAERQCRMSIDLGAARAPCLWDLWRQVCCLGLAPRVSEG